ncbi:hypothetical protein QFZ24_003261 [Streptomyces phaeochromogenes]|uniref:hypothetical protein n=1 Tax=Streptomyces phaeochromogenes TaxID=1923 RepID=UPI00278E7762|nr:hypothetical protein [Streptomyces phaeochromogenes]MDQ0949338.1 hypothetical protein [Streptomyces phaeochromogenes]
MTVRTAWLLPNGQTREDTRLAPVGTYAPESEMRTRDGVLPGGNPFAATGAGAMDLQIGAGRAVVQGTDAQGAYPAANDAPVTLTFADGGAQFGRIDTVALRVYDQLFDVNGQNLARIEIIRGPETAPPLTAPAMPSACLRLWDVTVPAGASAGVGGINWSAALADRRRFTVAPGGIIPRGWGLSFDGAYDGQYRDNGGVLERWSATARAWQTYRAPVEVTGWIEPALAAGYTNNGNAQGNLRYRRIILAGTPHMQWRGGVSWSTSGSPPNSAQPLAAALTADYCPARHTSVSMAAGGVPMKCDFQTTGAVRFITNTNVTTWAGFGGILYPLDA